MTIYSRGHPGVNRTLGPLPTQSPRRRWSTRRRFNPANSALSAKRLASIWSRTPHQYQYGEFWMEGFCAYLAETFPKKPHFKQIPRYAAGRKKSTGVSGVTRVFGEFARSYISACMWVARNIIMKFLEQMHFLMAQLGPNGQLQRMSD